MAKREYTAEDVDNIYKKKYGKTDTVRIPEPTVKKQYTAEDVDSIYERKYGTNQNAVDEDAFNYAVNKIGGGANGTSLTSGLSEDTLKLFDTYNTYDDAWKNELRSGAMGLTGEQNMRRYYDSMSATKNKLVSEHGISEADFDKIALERRNGNNADVQAYYEKKQDALGKISQDGLKQLDAYNAQKSAWESQLKSGDMGITGDQNLLRYSDAMNSAKEAVMKEYGITSEEFERIAQYRKENTDAAGAQASAESIAERVKENPKAWGTALSVLDVVTSPVHGVMAAGESLNRLTYADKEAPVNTNSANYAWQNFAQATERAVNEEIDSSVGKFAYNVAMSTGKAGMGILTGSGVAGSLGLVGKSAQVVNQLVTLPTFGASAYASTLQADQNKGISTENATKHALVAGMAEMATELLPLEELFRIAGSAGKATAKQTILSILKQAGLEGAEEGISGIANHIADNIINGDMSEYNQTIQAYMEEGKPENIARGLANWEFFTGIMEDVVAGAISGGVMGAGATVAGKISYNKLGTEVNNDSELKNAVVEAAMTMDDSTTAKEIVSGKDVKELTNADMAKVLESMDAIVGNEAVDAVRGQILERTQKRADLRHAEEAQAQNTANENVQTAQITPVTRVESSTATQSTSRPATIRKKKYSSVGNALLNASAQPIIAVQLENITNNEATVRIDNPDGGEQVVKLSEITMQDETKQQLYNFASKMDTAKAGNAVINNYSGEPLDTYAEACAVFYYGGKLGTSSFEQLISNPKNTKLAAGVADVSTLKLLYEMGANNRSQKNAEVAPVQRKTANKQAGKVTDNRTNKSDNRMKEVAEVVAKRTGLEITLNDNLEHGENGHFQQALSRIALSETSQNQFETLVHELNEFSGTYNPEGMKRVMDVVLDYAQSKEGVAYLTKRVQQYQDAYKQVESDKTYEGAAEEFVFDYLAGVFSQKEGVESFVQFMEKENMPETEQKNIIDTVTNFFKQLFHKISAYLEEHMMSDTARRGLDADAQKAQEIREMVLEVWEGAIEESKTNKNVSADTKYSLNKNEYENAVDKELYTYVLEVMNGEKKWKPYVLSKKISEKLAKDIENIVGFSVLGYENAIGPSEIVHIDKKHGKSGKSDHSMADLHELARIQYVVDNYTNIVEGKRSEHYRNSDGSYAKTVVLQTRVDDGYYYIVEAVPDSKKKTLMITSAFKNKKDILSEGVHVENDPNRNVQDAAQQNISSTDSIPRSEENVTKKYSINIDETLFNELEDTYTEQEQGDASIVQQGFESLKNVSVDEKLMNRIAYAIKKDYQSAYDKEQLTKNLTRVFAYLKDTQNVQYEDMVRIVREIARPVLEQSTDINEYEKQMYDDFRDYFKGMKIALTEEQMAEVAHYHGSYENFRRMNFGKITFDINGTSLDNLWDEICEHSYGMLDVYASVADQPILLMDLMNELKPVKRNIYGMNIDEAAYDLALDIFRRFFAEQAQEKANATVNEKAARLVKRQQEFRQRVNEEYQGKLERMKKSEAERRERLTAYYEDKLDDAQRSYQAALDHMDKQAAETIKKQAQRFVEILGKVKQTNDAMIKLKAKQRQNTIDRHRNEDIRRYRERIKRNASGIITYFNTNTDKKHVPEALKDSVAQFITSIDFVSERANPDSMAQLEWQNSLRKLKDRLGDQGKAAEEGYEEIYNALMDRDSGDARVSSLLNDMQNFLNENENVRVTDLGMNELKRLDEMMTALKRAITTVNQLYVNKRTNDVAQLGDASIADLERKKDKKVSASKAVQMADNLLNVNMLDARSFFHTLGENAMSIYDGLRTGFSERVWLIKEAQEHIEKILKGKNIYNWTGENAKVHTFIVNGKELRMTTGQIMSLYELKKRRQADIHMKVGGIIPTDFKSSSKSVEIKGKEYGVGKKNIEHRAKGTPVTDYEVDMICNVLTAEQRQVADAMQQFLANNCAAWGNRASMKMYGYKRFGVKDYFPIKTDGMSVDTKDDSKFFGTKNRGFTKETMKNASNALMVDDIFDVFTNHVTEMATYSTFTAPLMDAMKWFNYKQKSFNGKFSVQENTIKSEINRVYGKHYIEYFQKLIKDINAESAKGIESQISDHMVSRMKAASVGANLRVAIQQPTAYIRAAAVMDLKYLVKAVFTKAGTKKAKEHSAIAQWKSWGYFETSIGRSMKNVITGQDTLRNKVVEKSMILAQLGDDFTWGYLWNACEAEIRDKRPELEYNSEEFLAAVSERFDEVVDQTQVVDTVLHRSQIMRKDDVGTKMVTAFMSEPTKSYNLLMNAARDVIESKGIKGKKYFGRVVVAYLATQTINAAVTAIIDAMRDLDDDDETFWKNWSQAFSENVVDNVNPINSIPYAKDLVSLYKGYDISRMDMQGVSNLLGAAQKIQKYVTDEDYRKKHTWFSVMKSFVQGLSQVGGIPAYNLIREVEGIWHTVTGDFMGGIIHTIDREYELMADGLREGDMEKYEEAKKALEDRGKDDDAIDTGVKDKIIETYLENEEGQTYEETVKLLMQQDKKLSEDDAKQAIEDDIMTKLKNVFLDKDVTKEEAEKVLKEHTALNDNQIFITLRGWEWRAANPNTTRKKYDYCYLYDAFNTAYEANDIKLRSKVQEEVTILRQHGYSTTDIVDAITGEYREDYLDLKEENKHADMKNALISVFMQAGLSNEKALKKVDGWYRKKD